MITPANILRISEFCRRAWPKKDAEAPKIIKTVEKPRQNKIKGKKFIFFEFDISWIDWPEIYEIYPGIKGKTHGDKKLIIPAPKAIINSIIYPVFFIAAEIPAIEVNRASFKYFLLWIFLLFFNFLITIGWIPNFSSKEVSSAVWRITPIEPVIVPLLAKILSTPNEAK